MEDTMENNKKSASIGKALLKPGLVAALLLTAVSLTACVVPVDRDFRGGSRQHHNEQNWNGGGSWQGNGGGWNHHH